MFGIKSTNPISILEPNTYKAVSETQVKPRIVFINHWAKHAGGAEYSLLDILYRIRKCADVCLITSEPGFLIDRARELGIQCYICPCKHSIIGIRRENMLDGILRNWKSIVSFTAFVLQLRKILSFIQPQLIHANIPKSHMALSLVALSGFTSCYFFHIREIFCRYSLAYRLYGTFLSGVKNIHILSISWAVHNGLPPKIRKFSRVLYNGVPIPHSTKRFRQKTLVRFIYLGRIVPWKGCHMLLEAFSRLCSRRGHDKVTLSLVGPTTYWDVTYRNELHSMIDAFNLSNNCIILPNTTTPLSILQLHDIFCIASLNEPFGRVIAEANACGMPVIGFNTGGIPEIVESGKTGILVPYGDLPALVNAMEFCIDRHHDLYRMGKAGRKRVTQYFNREKQVEAISTYLLSCALESGRNSKDLS
jgi:glycosyltransferase involved in cell wall biosynthesis